MGRNIIWAVDAFDSPGDLLNSAVETVTKLAPSLEARVEPVYVLAPQSEYSTDFSESLQLALDNSPAAMLALKSILKGLAIPNLESPHVIVVNTPSTAHLVDALSNFAVEKDADAIIVSSHGRSGLGRFFLGSFAETLLFRSKVPVVVVHPHLASHPGNSDKITKILFPTDFGPHAEDSFREVVELAAALGSEITLFHSVIRAVEPVLQSGAYLLGGGWMPIHNFFDDQSGRRKRRANAWARWALECKNVKMDSIISTEAGNTPELIQKVAEEGAFDLIALRTNSGPISSILLGSTTKTLVRHAPCPVWILRKDVKSTGASKIRAA